MTAISIRKLLILAALAASVFGVTTCAGGSSGSSLPTDPQELSAGIAANDAALRQGLASWRAAGDPPTSPPPAEVTGPANYVQSAASLLAGDPGLSAATLPLVPAGIRREIRDLTIAARDLRRLSAGSPPHEISYGAPRPLAELLGYYRAAQARYGIGRHYLAAINLVETKFGRAKSASTAGAKGPMQFEPATWRIYGHGGDINDPHDAILAAANLLRHSGAPRSYTRALHSYNPSRLYVDAVQRYAGVIARDRDGVYFLYSWQP